MTEIIQRAASVSSVGKISSRAGYVAEFRIIDLNRVSKFIFNLRKSAAKLPKNLFQLANIKNIHIGVIEILAAHRPDETVIGRSDAHMD